MGLRTTGNDTRRRRCISHTGAERVELPGIGRIFPMDGTELAAQVCSWFGDLVSLSFLGLEEHVCAHLLTESMVLSLSP